MIVQGGKEIIPVRLRRGKRVWRDAWGGMWSWDACSCHFWGETTAIGIVRVVVGLASWGTGVVKYGLRFVLVLSSLIRDIRIGHVMEQMLQAWVRRVKVPYSTVLSFLWVAVRAGCWYVTYVWYTFPIG